MRKKITVSQLQLGMFVDQVCGSWTDHPFWKAEGIVVLPHIGGPHPQRDKFVARLFVENLGRFLDGKPLREVVDRTAGY